MAFQFATSVTQKFITEQVWRNPEVSFFWPQNTKIKEMSWEYSLLNENYIKHKVFLFRAAVYNRFCCYLLNKFSLDCIPVTIPNMGSVSPVKALCVCADGKVVRQGLGPACVFSATHTHSLTHTHGAARASSVAAVQERAHRDSARELNGVSLPTLHSCEHRR